MKAQLASAYTAIDSSDAYARKLAEEKMSLLAQVNKERSAFDQYKSTCIWALKYMEYNKNKHFSQ